MYVSFFLQTTSEVPGVIEITLVDVLDMKLVVELTNKEVVTLTQQSLRILQEDIDFIRWHRFELPSFWDESVVSGILIGIDHYWDIIYQEVTIFLPSGIVLGHTRFGSHLGFSALLPESQAPPRHSHHRRSTTKTKSSNFGRRMTRNSRQTHFRNRQQVG